MSHPRFISLGGVWLDDIQVGARITHEKIIGGSVTFATLGARLFSPDEPSNVRLLLRAGRDFPLEAISALRTWKTGLSVEWVEHKPTARGVVRYDEHNASKRTYQRLTEPLLTSSQHLTLSDILRASCFHFFDTPKAVKDEINQITDVRLKHGVTESHAIIWEPQAKTCNSEMLTAHLETAALVTVFSPNHVELEGLFSDALDVEFGRSRVEARARRFLDAGIGEQGKGCIVVRAAEHGCLVWARDIRPTWLPAVHQSGSGKVVDTTGAGNAFLGGFAIGLSETNRYSEAAKYGQVAASFAIEQVGLPVVTGEGEDELWNGASVAERLDSYSLLVDDLSRNIRVDPVKTDELNAR